MFVPLALLVVAVALFPAAVVRHRVRTRPAPTGPGSTDLEQVQGFVYVGSGTLVLLGVAVVVLGLAGRPGQAEAMGTLGLIAYLVYLLVALVLIRRTSRRVARRAAPSDEPSGWLQPPA